MLVSASGTLLVCPASVSAGGTTLSPGPPGVLPRPPASSVRLLAREECEERDVPGTPVSSISQREVGARKAEGRPCRRPGGYLRRGSLRVSQLAVQGDHVIDFTSIVVVASTTSDMLAPSL